MAEVFDSGLNTTGPVGFHEFDMPGAATWVQITFPSFARRYVLHSVGAALEIAVTTANGDGGAAVAGDRRFPIAADSPWSQPLSRGKGQGLSVIYVRDPAGGTGRVHVAAEAFEGG